MTAKVQDTGSLVYGQLKNRILGYFYRQLKSSRFLKHPVQRGAFFLVRPIPDVGEFCQPESLHELLPAPVLEVVADVGFRVKHGQAEVKVEKHEKLPDQKKN